MQRAAIVVAGMHRSGTSALTRVLASLGCALPKTLMEPNEYNTEGYWESEAVAALNDAVLESAGSSWDDWEPFNPEWYASPVAATWRERARKVLEDEFGDSRLFVLKDPRACRLLPFWTDALTAFGADPHVVLPIRNPLEVADSLRERDTIDPSVGLLLWLRNVLEAEAASRNLPRAFVRFEDLLRNWQPLAEVMGRDLGLSWPRRSTSANLEIGDGLNPSARHHLQEDSAVLDNPELSRWIESTFEILDRWTRGEARASDREALDATRVAFGEAGTAFARPIASGMRAGQRNVGLEREVDALNAVVADREGQIDSLNRAVADRDDNVAHLDGVVRDKDRELDRLGRNLTERDRTIDALNHDIAGRDGEIKTRGDRIEALEGVVVDRDGQIESLHGVIDHRDQELAGVYASASWRVTKPLRTGKQALLGGARAVSRGMRRAIQRTLRISWRLLPLPRGTREALRRRALRWAPKTARPGSGPAAPRGYVDSGWLDLADLHYEARRNDGSLPILFHPEWYLATNPDIRTAGIDPLTHYVEHGAVEGRWPVDLEADAIDPTIEALHRLDVGSEDAEAFDPAFARVLYPDLAALSDGELALVCGEGTERVGSKGRFVADLCENPREIPLDFQAAEYIRLYPDLRWLADQSPLEALRHYMCHGRFEPRLHTVRADPVESSVEAAGGDGSVPGPGRSERPLCVLVHVFYPELWEELSGYIRNLPAGSYDLYVNLVDDTFDATLLGRVRDTFPEARVYVSENVGRDIGGHFQLLRNLPMEDYRLFCLLHTKKSPHMAEGEVQRWRRKLLEPLLGTPDCAAKNVEAMLDDDSIGVLGSAQCRYCGMTANREKYDLLLERLQVSEDMEEPEFLSGTMMLVRREVLRRVFDAAGGIVFEHSADHAGQGDPDGAWAHAVERVFGAVVRDLNYRFEWR
ncbi:MAG: hypothetical protein OXM56_05015 [Gammaproteobacteria bacterium]|nr:hypothetical protein [Gammaproteobacteria bacterium]